MEIGIPTLEVEDLDIWTNDEALLLNLDHLKEKRNNSQLHVTEYQNRYGSILQLESEEASCIEAK